MTPFTATQIRLWYSYKILKWSCYFLFSTTVVFGWRLAVAWVTKCPVMADRGLPPEDPFFLLI